MGNLHSFLRTKELRKNGIIFFYHEITKFQNDLPSWQEYCQTMVKGTITSEMNYTVGRWLPSHTMFMMKLTENEWNKD